MAAGDDDPAKREGMTDGESILFRARARAPRKIH